MAFFRKWKTNYKHKKFTSDDVIDGEDWGLDKNGKQLSPNATDIKLDLNEFNGISADDDDDEDEDNKPPTCSYDIKYLGCTPIEGKRSEKTTSEAIKTVIANSKAGGRKNKSQKRVKLTVSPDGIEVCDHHTNESMMRFSIYKISYCSVDAAHDHAFSFVGSEVDALTEKERMSCHVFQCPKRKIAHEITLMVARCFENAYQHWRDAVLQNVKRQGMSVDGPISSPMAVVDVRQVLKAHNGGGLIESHAEVHHEAKSKQDDLLIDLVSSSSDYGASMRNDDVRKYLQNTWVSFEDDAREGAGVHLVAC